MKPEIVRHDAGLLVVPVVCATRQGGMSHYAAGQTIP
jgi:hypothetical protein